MPSLSELQQWIGRLEIKSDRITDIPVAAMRATLDIDAPFPAAANALPPLWHWLYFLPLHRRSDIGEDGHAKRGGFLPPVPLPRRMWAGGRLQFLQPLHVGEAIERTSRIVSVDAKEGRTGSLVFVLVRHEISGPSGLAVVEEHDIVYRGTGGAAAAGVPAPADHAWERTIHADEVMLFRYSALTFNSHRIHYDRSYVTSVEGYPGLIVHGPLIATLLLELVREKLPGARISAYRFKAVRPLFDTSEFSVCGKASGDGKSVSLWARDSEGLLAMEATATLA